MAENYYGEDEEYGEQQEYEYAGPKPKLGNNLPVWGNQRTMNINNLVLTNIQASPYFKIKLYGLKTYHEVVDEIYYKIDNLEPWERGSRKTAGQTGMCGGVRGVGTGGIVSTSFCILYKLFTLKLTRKQLNGMLNHADSPYIRGLGFMYIRFCQPPKDLFDWYEPYLDDPEEIDVKAGGGCSMTIGQMVRTLLTKLEWFATLFPRIPVPIQKQIEERLKARMVAARWANRNSQEEEVDTSQDRSSQTRHSEEHDKRGSSRSHSNRRETSSRHRSRSKSSDRQRSRKRSKDRERRHDSDRKRNKRSRSRDRGSRDRDRKRKSHSPSKDSRKHRSRSHERRKKDHKERKRRDKDKDRSRERDRERSHRSR